MVSNLRKNVFTPADILLPAGAAMENWSVIACDQFTSQRDYWDRVRERVGDAPSTLNMIIPEAYLDGTDEREANARISAAMEDYTKRGILREVTDSYIYVERTLTDGRVRRGIVGTVDLEEYDFSGGEASILASEHTDVGRLPARIGVRRAALLELPHIITFIDDKEATVIEPLAAKADRLPLLYDFELMEGGGRIRGMRVTGGDAAGISAAMRSLQDKSGTLMVMGDGNHSLAAAKVCWNEIKQGLNDSEREDHPARRALVEVNNVYDPAVSFEAIHRVLFDVDPADYIKKFTAEAPSGDDYRLRWISRGQEGVAGVSAACIGDMLTLVQEFTEEYAAGAGCRIDYIHDADTAERLAREEDCLVLMLPPMDKSELFGTVEKSGVFPKKSFSVGHARDKRYYIECRIIK